MEAIQRVLASYTKLIPLSRRDFVVAFAMWALLCALVGFAYVLTIGPTLQVTTHLITKSVVELLLLFAFVPPLIARLRDIGWPVLFVLVFFVAWLVSPRNVLLGAYLLGNGQISPAQTAVILGIGAISVILFLLLVAKGSRG